MKGQKVVVTGANRGLGLEFCRQLRELGAEVIATARRPQAAFDLRTLEVRIETLDVTSAESVEAFATSTRYFPGASAAASSLTVSASTPVCLTLSMSKGSVGL